MTGRRYTYWQADGGEGWYGDDFGYGGYENNDIYGNQ